MECLLGTLRGAGFDPDTTYHVYHLLDGYIIGFSLWEIAYATISEDVKGRASTLMETIPWNEYPHLAQHRDQHLSEGPHQDVSAFDFGLDLILDGLEKTRRF